jgi:ATP-binding cassette subfamily B protein
MMGATKYDDLTLFKRLLRQARPYWSHIASILVLRLLSTPLVLLLPLPLKIAVDNAIGSHALPAFLDRLLPTAYSRN